jgi:hypothetical protein
MLCKSIRAFAVIVLPLLLNIHAMQTHYRYVVKGRVVNSFGQPAADALIVLHPPQPPGELILTERADSAGKFRWEDTLAFPTQELVLYVTSPLPQNAFAPITPPFDELSSTNQSFSGRPIVLQSGETNLEDVPLQVRYGIVNLRIEDRTGNPLFTEINQLPYLWLRVRSPQGNFVNESGLSRSILKNSVRAKESAIAIALPEGIWGIEIAIGDEPNRNWHAVNGPVLVSASDNPQHVTLRLSGSNHHSYKRCTNDNPQQ